MDTDAVNKVIQGLEDDLRIAMENVRETKIMINRLCTKAGLAERYPDAQDAAQSIGEPIKPDQYYGKPLATAVREYLEWRRARKQGPATVSEIHEALAKGGYPFETKDSLNAKRGLRVSLTKNAVVFHKLPNGSWGLLDWYPEARLRRSSRREQSNGAGGSDQGTEADTTEEDES